jgi:hypothetical protein
VAAVALSMVLASITYLFVELPIRRAISPATLRRAVPIVVPMAAIGIAMAVAIRTGWLTPPARTALQIDTKVPIALNESLCRERFAGLGEYCQQFDPALPVTTALLGDSHAAHFFPGLGALLQAKGEGIVHLGQTGCPPLVGIERLNQTADNSCGRVNRAVIDAVLADKSIVNVWLSFRGAVAVTGSEVDNGSPAELYRTIGGTATNGDAIGPALRETINLLKSREKRVGLILQVPELGFRVDECTGRPFSLAHRPARVPCVIPRAHVMARQSAYRNLVALIQGEYKFAVYDPVPALCDDVSCYAVADGHVLYFDDNHLGVFGSSWALRGF